MPIASPPHRHQTSLEGGIDLSPPTSTLSSEQRQKATRAFTTVIKACEPLQNHKPYKQVTLVRLTFEYARSDVSRDNFLHFFFQRTQIPTDDSQVKPISASDCQPGLIAFADTLVENFFLPCESNQIFFDTQ